MASMPSQGHGWPRLATAAPPTPAGRRPTKTHAGCVSSRPLLAAAVKGCCLPQTVAADRHRTPQPVVVVVHRPPTAQTYRNTPPPRWPPNPVGGSPDLWPPAAAATGEVHRNPDGRARRGRGVALGGGEGHATTFIGSSRASGATLGRRRDRERREEGRRL
nr:unnamed protein product [Digitaria exilis]